LSACGPLGTKIARRLSGPLLGHGLIEDAHDVALLHDQELDAVDLHLGAGPFSEQHAVADLEVDGDEFPGLVTAAGADADDLGARFSQVCPGSTRPLHFIESQFALQSLYSWVVASDAFLAFIVNQPRLRFSRSRLIASRRSAVPRCTLASSKPIV
jgi:hypothetical protein